MKTNRIEFKETRFFVYYTIENGCFSMPKGECEVKEIFQKILKECNDGKNLCDIEKIDEIMIEDIAIFLEKFGIFLMEVKPIGKKGKEFLVKISV